jgi:hypothetical protein
MEVLVLGYDSAGGALAMMEKLEHRRKSKAGARTVRIEEYILEIVGEGCARDFAAQRRLHRPLEAAGDRARART